MEKTIDDVCEELDSLSLRSLELIEEKVHANMQLEKMMRDGNIELAKARYIRGKESIGSLQIPQDDQMNSLFELSTNTSEQGGKKVPTFDVSLKPLKDSDAKSRDPIRWFGVLVPQNLRTAQKRFQDSLYLAVRVANISAELETIPGELATLRSLKTALTK